MSDFIVGNRGGIVYANATQVNAGGTTTNAIYTLPNHIFRNLGPAGLMVVTVTNGTSTIPGVTVLVNGLSLTLTDAENNSITTVQVGDHLLSFNKTNNTIKMFL